MTEETISRDDAARMKSQIDGLVADLHRQGFSRQMIGAAMSGTGVALAYANGHDFDNLVDMLRSQIEQQH